MQIKQCLIAFFLLIHITVQAGEIVLSGVYQGKNIYVQNPLSGDKKNYCTDEVYINDELKMSGIKSSAFEIDLSSFAINEPVTVKITYKDDCTPKVLNSYALRASGSFQFNSFDVKDNEISWTTTGEKTQYVYYLEQLVNNNWLVLKSVHARGEAAGIYKLPITHKSKSCKYRIKVQDQETHQIYYSKAIDFTLTQEPITFYPKSVSTKITLSRESNYQVLTPKGELVKKGKGTEIPLSDLQSGVYFLHINDQKERFFKK